jgi:hypothetical protein
MRTAIGAATGPAQWTSSAGVSGAAQSEIPLKLDAEA